MSSQEAATEWLVKCITGAVSTINDVRDKIPGSNEEKIAGTSWWFPIVTKASGPSPFVSFAHCLGLSNSNIEFLIEAADYRRWFKAMIKSNIVISKRRHNKHQYIIMGTPDEYVRTTRTSPKSQMGLSKPLWVQNLSIPDDQRGLLIEWIRAEKKSKEIRG